MATYVEIQQYVRAQNGYVAQTCWIAHVLEQHGLTRRQGHNRINPMKRKHLCPDAKRPDIEAALRHFKMI
jgi:hypothetical protein